MLAVGLWGAQMGGRSVWTLPATFPLIMCLGGVLGDGWQAGNSQCSGAQQATEGQEGALGLVELGRGVSRHAAVT